MIPVFIIVFLLFIVINEYGWRGGVYYTIAASFLQDPIRKLTEGQSVYFGGICLLLFGITFIQLKSGQPKWMLNYIFWTNKRMNTLLEIFIYFLGVSAAISLSTFRDLRLTIVGLLFYILPLLSVWVGFQVGTNINTVRTMLKTYVFACSVTALSILISLWGVENKLLEEVGTGLDITGIDVKISGLWRTSEIAGWHLAAGSCMSFLLGLCNKKVLWQIFYFFLSLSLVFLASTTSRRKSVGLVMLYVGLLLLFYLFTAKRRRFVQIIGGILIVFLIGSGAYSIALNENALNIVSKTSERASTLTLETTSDRFSIQGLGALEKGIIIGGPFGYGVGAGSNTSNSGIDKSVSERSLGFVSEGGGGRIMAELGWVGGTLVLILLFNLGLLIKRNTLIGLTYLDTDEMILMSGLTIFAISNIVSFFSASQLYSDPFVLLVIGLSFGASLGIVVLSSNKVNTEQYQSKSTR